MVKREPDRSVAISEREQAIWSNPAALASLKAGLEEARARDNASGPPGYWTDWENELGVADD